MEMDYLREGINLRAMGQLDPLVAWQADGYDMFGKMIARVNDDYLRYVLHVETLERVEEEPDLAQVNYQAADDPAQDFETISQSLAHQNQEFLAANLTAPFAGALDQQPARAGTPDLGGDTDSGYAPVPTDPAGAARSSRQPGHVNGAAAKVEAAKVGRNDPCWCGSGKKYKFCHGAT
jgi:preprotein translocase subunit SecA